MPNVTWMPNVGNPGEVMVVDPIFGLILTKDGGSTWYVLGQAPKENKAVTEFFRICLENPGCPFKEEIQKELQQRS